MKASFFLVFAERNKTDGNFTYTFCQALFEKIPKRESHETISKHFFHDRIGTPHIANRMLSFYEKLLTYRLGDIVLFDNPVVIQTVVNSTSGI